MVGDAERTWREQELEQRESRYFDCDDCRRRERKRDMMQQIMKGCEEDKVDQSKAVIANGPSKACNTYECLLQRHSNLSLSLQSLCECLVNGSISFNPGAEACFWTF